MVNISITQLINLWVSLEDAYNGVNKYGGDTAEIYAYTLQPRSPTYRPDKEFTGFMAKIKDDLEFNASKSLYNILILFQTKRKCSVFINNKKLGKWVKRERFIHRVHVKIIKKIKVLK